MLRDLRSTLNTLPPNLFRAGILLITVTIIGIAGYMIIEGWSFLDAVYMTVIVLTTIGFEETRPLNDIGRIFTIFLAIFGVGAIFYTLIAGFQFLIEGELGNILGGHRMKSQIESIRDHYILCGFGRVGEEIARQFVSRNVTFVVIENTPEAVERARQRGYPLLVGDATTDEMLRAAGVERAVGLLAASDSDAGNTFIALTAKALNPAIHVIARAAYPDNSARMERAGADRVFSPYVTAGRQMAISAVQPLMVEFIETIAVQAGDQILAELDITPTSGLAGRTVGDILHDDRAITVLGLRRKGVNVIVGPTQDTRLEAGDRVILIGDKDDLDKLQPRSATQS
ncbi:MAG: potassium channel protein [Chloroflexota bacterium]